MANIFQNPGIKNNPEKGRYSDPIIPGMGSPYNKRGCKQKLHIFLRNRHL